MKLTRYWFEFENHPRYRVGVGVTAWTYDDAIFLMRGTVFAEDGDVPNPDRVIEDIAITDLDQNHVVPNMEVPTWRGVWFPRGHTRNEDPNFVKPS